jgi:hypothetical protein
MDSDRHDLRPPRQAWQALEGPSRRPSIAAIAGSAGSAPMAGSASIATVVTALALLLAVPAARADDRSLLHATQQNPYVMIILDTSGSMHQEVACSAADVAAGFCSAECDPGDCLPRMMGDDPDSKIYVAKQSIYTIMQSHPNISFGFGHFDQTQLQVFWKYWWYSVAISQPSGFIKLDSGRQFPAPGQQELFGQQAWPCTLGGPAPFNNVGCVATQPAHLDNSWEIERARRYPKLGDQNNAAGWSYYINEVTGGVLPLHPLYRVTFTPVTGQVCSDPTKAPSCLGSPTLLVSVKVDKCSTNNSCATTTPIDSKTMTFNLANQTVYWEPGGGNLTGSNIPDVNGNGGEFYAGANQAAREIQANYSAANHQLEPNTDTASNDPWKTGGTCLADPNPVCNGLPFAANTCTMMQPTCNDALGRTPANSFSVGDIIPLDWTTNQQTAIMLRMAPNLLNPANTIHDFGIATYVADHPLAGETGLRLLNAAQRPLAPEGGTPTGNVMKAFFTLMTGLTPPLGGAPAGFQAVSNNSWIGTASGATGDPFFSCKPAYVLLLTDGLASSDDGNWNADTSQCPAFTSWSGKPNNPTPGYACCVAEALRSINVGASHTPYPIRTYVIGLGLTTTTVGGYNNTLQCVADEGGTGNRHFFKGILNTVAGQPPGFPASDPPAFTYCCNHAAFLAGECSPENPCGSPPANFCCSDADFSYGNCAPLNPCDGPGPILPQSKQDILNALQNVLNLISSQATAFASAAVPSIQSNVQNKELITSFLPLNQPIWPGRVDAFTDPVPRRTVPVILPDGMPSSASVPDTRPSADCTSPGQQGCHLWNAGGGQVQGGPPTGDTVLAQGLQGLDTAGNDPTKRRIYYAPFTPIVPGELRLNFKMPPVTDTAHLYDLENAMGLCGTGYAFYAYPPPIASTCTENAALAGSICTTGASTNPCPSQPTIATPPYPTAQQAVAFTEAIKTYQDPTTTLTVQYLLGDIFHSDPQVLGQPVNSTLFDGNVDGYQAFATAERFRRKVLYFGDDDGEVHALDVGTVQQGLVAGSSAWTFSNGTGSEIFAFIPRTVMPTLSKLAIGAAPPLNGGAQTYMVDGPPHLAEGFFDATGVASSCSVSNPPATCQWHSLVIAGLREGGHGYYALDVTQPDTLQPNFETPNDSTTPAIQLPNPTAASYLPNCLNGGAGCGQLPYPTPLWEFTDSVKVLPSCSNNCQLKPADEDASGPGVGKPDLGETWSRPNSGRVRICDTGACATFHEQWVVIFGGGLDRSLGNSQGNWLYMLDMATGKVIYKRQLNGAVPSEPAAVDTGQDGYVDTIYIGTTAGHLYKVDLSQAAPIDGATGRVSTAVNAGTGQPFWQPFEIFDTEGRQIFFPPAVFFDTDRNQYGLAFGTGNRFDLWTNTAASDKNSLDGRFYVMIDTGFTAANTPTPFKATNLQALAPNGGTNSAANFLLSPPSGKQPGYFFDLPGDGIANDPNERVIAEPFVLAGALIFASYVPKQLTSVAGNNAVCADTGDTHGFLLNVNNGDPILLPAQATGLITSASGRYFILSKDLGLNISTSESTPIIVTKQNPNPPAELPLSTAVQTVLSYIMKHMPPNCRFTNKRININVTDTFNNTFNVGAVPVCIIEKNWKEF